MGEAVEDEGEELTGGGVVEAAAVLEGARAVVEGDDGGAARTEEEVGDSRRAGNVARGKLNAQAEIADGAPVVFARKADA